MGYEVPLVNFYTLVGQLLLQAQVQANNPLIGPAAHPQHAAPGRIAERSKAIELNRKTVKRHLTESRNQQSGVYIANKVHGDVHLLNLHRSDFWRWFRSQLRQLPA